MGGEGFFLFKDIRLPHIVCARVGKARANSECRCRRSGVAGPRPSPMRGTLSGSAMRSAGPIAVLLGYGVRARFCTHVGLGERWMDHMPCRASNTEGQWASGFCDAAARCATSTPASTATTGTSGIGKKSVLFLVCRFVCCMGRMCGQVCVHSANNGAGKGWRKGLAGEYEP